MSWFLRRRATRSAGRHFRLALLLITALGLALASLAAGASRPVAPAPWRFQLVNVGGGSGGRSGDEIWSETWWYGSPQGPGPYEGSPPEGEAICTWHDLGPGLARLDSGLSEASLPVSFWKRPDGGGHPGIWGVDQWAIGLLRQGTATDHFDLVACPESGQVPATGGDVESNVPLAHPPKREPLFVWIFWDTVPDPPSGNLPGIIGEAYDRTPVPSPAIGTSPSEVGGVADATVVNLPTWLWVEPGIWHTTAATASGGGYVATVWAVPVSVTWMAGWDFPSASDDPEGGTTFGPEVLNEVCDGPGSVYDPGAPGQSTDCSFVFTQSSFGTDQRLEAAVTWDVSWALSDAAGVVGGEGSLGDMVTIGTRALRVMQVESVISSG
ncbi:MAG: hypothetical protein ABSH30_08475 [Acidimicrobiales bacterium]